jgi:hypothetical protein
MVALYFNAIVENLVCVVVRTAVFTVVSFVLYRPPQRAF